MWSDVFLVGDYVRFGEWMWYIAEGLCDTFWSWYVPHTKCNLERPWNITGAPFTNMN